MTKPRGTLGTAAMNHQKIERAGLGERGRTGAGPSVAQRRGGEGTRQVAGSRGHLRQGLLLRVVRRTGATRHTDTPWGRIHGFACYTNGHEREAARHAVWVRIFIVLERKHKRERKRKGNQPAS